MTDCDVKFVKISKASEILGVQQGILRRWADDGKITSIKTPGGMRLFDISSLHPSLNRKTIIKQEQVTILYSRVSSSKQKDDLKRQKEFLTNSLPIKYS